MTLKKKLSDQIDNKSTQPKYQDTFDSLNKLVQNSALEEKILSNEDKYIMDDTIMN